MDTTGRDDENAWTMESMDISGVGRAPFIRFRLNHDRSTIEADPPGGHIRIAALNEGAERSRIVLTSTVTGEVFADIESRHVVAPSRGDDWNTATAHATEVAAALYWSMWRMQQLQAQEASIRARLRAEEPRHAG